jgi:signal transduction histidine kinase/CheY-like chemotaxis protein/integral membrane sensor domain MASE1
MAYARVRLPKQISLALEAFGVGFVVFALDFLSLAFTRSAGAVAAIWPTDGVVLGLMVSGRFKRPWRLLAPSLVGAVLAELSWGDLPLLAVGLPAANMLGIACAFLLLGKILADFDPEKPRRLVIFLLITMSAALGSAVLGAGLLHWATGAALGRNVLIWAAAVALGYWTLTPLVQILARQSAPLEPRRLVRDAWVLTAFLALIFTIFGQRQYPLLFLAPLGLFAVAYVSEMRGAAIAILVMIGVGAFLSGLGQGPVALVAGDSNKKLIMLQIFLASMTISILPIAAAMAERRAVFQSLAQARDLAIAEERRARNANRMVHMAEEIALVGHWHRDLTTGLSTWSDQMMRLFGSPTGGAAPSRELALSAVHPEDRPILIDVLDRAELDGAAATLDVRINRPDSQRDLRVHVAAERDDNGVVTTVYGMVLDVTDSKAAQAALMAARQVAEKAATAKAEFLADMSHEIRTPLSSILGFSNLLRDLPGLSAEAERFADRITAAGESLLTAVGDILSLSKLEAGQVQIRRQAMSPASLIEEVIQMLQPQAAQKGLALRGHVEPGAPERLLADAPRLRQVLLNLAGNAVKFTDQGEVEVRLEYDAQRARMRIEVADTGPGIQNPQRLFERYAQMSSGAKDAGGGVGLGLAISKGLVESMGGSIGVRSLVGQGSVFWVEAPAAIVESANPLTRVLIADDLQINRELMRHSLSGLGLDITEAADGRAAVAASENQPFDVIVLDLAMPDGDGVFAAQAIRAKSSPDKRPTILAVSAAHPSDELIERLKVAGFDGFIPKPFVPSELAGIVQRFCS